MNADAHTNVFIMHTQTHTRKMHTDEQIQTHTKTYWQTSFRNRGKIPSFSTFGQIKCLAHTHTHTTVSDLSQCHASTDSIRVEPLFFFFFLSVVLFSSLSSLSFPTIHTTYTHFSLSWSQITLVWMVPQVEVWNKTQTYSSFSHTQKGRWEWAADSELLLMCSW